MSSEDTFYLMVGVVAVAFVLYAGFYYALLKLFNIDFRILFYAALAEYVGAWYDRKEKKDLESASDRRRSP